MQKVSKNMIFLVPQAAYWVATRNPFLLERQRSCLQKSPVCLLSVRLRPDVFRWMYLHIWTAGAPLFEVLSVPISPVCFYITDSPLCLTLWKMIKNLCKRFTYLHTLNWPGLDVLQIIPFVKKIIGQLQPLNSRHFGYQCLHCLQTAQTIVGQVDAFNAFEGKPEQNTDKKSEVISSF